MLAAGNSRASLMGIWVLLMLTLSYHYICFTTNVIACIFVVLFVFVFLDQYVGSFLW